MHSTKYIPDLYTCNHKTSIEVEINRESISTSHIVTVDDNGSMKIKLIKDFSDSNHDPHQAFATANLRSAWPDDVQFEVVFRLGMHSGVYDKQTDSCEL